MSRRGPPEWAPPWKKQKTMTNTCDTGSGDGHQSGVDVEPNGSDVIETNAIDGTPLIAVSRLPQKYRSVFHHRFPYFNYVQSKVFSDVFDSNKSIALCAPTGSGKTVVFELVIIKQLMDFDSRGQPLANLKVVYMAPLKKLVDEKSKEFSDSFNRFGLNCLLYTGDSDLEDCSKLSMANIILTTPEKWDAMVRGSRNNSIVQRIQLMLIDEVHSIGDDQRGALMEAVISRMKILRNVYMKTATDASKIRFIGVSATASNVLDFAHWLDPIDSVYYNLSVNTRPVRIQTLVIGVSQQDKAEFKFDINLNYRIDSVIRSHSDSKPTLIFCSTRKSVEMCAKHLSSGNGYILNQRQKLTLNQRLSVLSFKDKNIKNYIQKGVGFHHSGLELRDRQNVENLFVENLLPVLVSTTTLSMGVNLPAHLVIIKNTVQFQPNGVVQEYPSTQVMQMIGRAGRPQFDTSAVAVILTEKNKKDKYEMLVNGSQIIESKLHEHLIEHLNAEISLRTVTSIDIAVDWIRSTFLYIRLLQNPSRYSSCLKISNIKEGLEVLREWCQRELTGLKNADMIISDDEFKQFTSSAVGQFMTRHCISFPTMTNFCKFIKEDMELKDIINKLSKTQELMQEVQLRVNDKKFLNELNASKDQVCIRYPLEGKIKTTDMKINCLIQSTFGSLTIPDFTLSQEALRIMRTGQRLSRCLVDLIYFRIQQNVSRIYFKTLLNILIINKCFRAKLWHDSRLMFKQIPKIGNQFANSIMEEFKNFDELRRASPRTVEFKCNGRKPPFGTLVIDWVKKLPSYSVTIIQSTKCYSRTNAFFIKVKVALANYEDLKSRELLDKNHSFFLVVGSNDNQLFHCQQLYDSRLLRSNGSYETKEIKVENSYALDTIYAHLISDSYVGIDVRCALTPVFAADTHSPSDPSRTNCSTSFSDIDYQTDFVTESAGDRCQHKCANKSNCRHSCCKKWVNADETHKNDSQSLTQTNTKGKRQTDSQQNSKTNKKNKASNGQTSVPKNNLDKWIIKQPRVKVEAEETATHSKYFEKYSAIPDSDLSDIDFTEFDNDLEDFELKTDVMETNEQLGTELNQHLFDTYEQMEQMTEPSDIEPTVALKVEDPDEDVFDDELEKLLEYNFDLKSKLQCSEDFQDFDKTDPNHKDNDNNDNRRKISVFHAKDWIGFEAYRHAFPPGNLEGLTFYDERPKVTET